MLLIFVGGEIYEEGEYGGLTTEDKEFAAKRKSSVVVVCDMKATLRFRRIIVHSKCFVRRGGR